MMRVTGRRGHYEAWVIGSVRWWETVSVSHCPYLALARACRWARLNMEREHG